MPEEFLVMKHPPIKEETIDVFCKWSKNAIVKCFSANGVAVDLARNIELDAALDGCLNGVIKDVLALYEEALIERSEDIDA